MIYLLFADAFITSARAQSWRSTAKTVVRWTIVPFIVYVDLECVLRKTESDAIGIYNDTWCHLVAGITYHWGPSSHTPPLLPPIPVHSKMRFGPPPPRTPPQNASRYYNGQDVLSRWHIIDFTVLSFKIRSIDNDIYLERTVRSVTCRHYYDPIGMVDKRIKNSQMECNGS